MPSYPKSKVTRRKERQAEKRALSEYRSRQAIFAIQRDFDRCVICHFKFGRRRRRQHIHHVYGRGRKAGDWREHYTNLMCVCMDCHPLPIQTPGGNHALSWVEDIREKMNSDPINYGFEHIGEFSIEE